MRTDVKVAAVVSLGVVVLAAFYYFGRSEVGEPIALNSPTGDRLADASKSGGKAPATSSNAGRAQGASSSNKSTQRTPPGQNQPGTEQQGTSPTGRGQTGRSGVPGSANDPSEMFALGRTPDEEGAPRTLQEVLERGRQVDGSATSSEHTPGDQRDDLEDFDGDESAAVTDLSGKPSTDGAGDTSKTGGASSSLLRGSPANKPNTSTDSTKRDAGRQTQRYKAMPGAKRHVVGKGDTLAILAEVYYGSQRHTNELLAANPHVTDPARLVVGTVLNVPALGSAAPSVVTGNVVDRSRNAAQRTAASGTAASGDTYSVRQGDSFYSISQTFLGSGARWREIYELNRDVVGDDPSRLRVGQTLKLPVSSSATASNTNG